jgi:hypothetical protein
MVRQGRVRGTGARVILVDADTLAVHLQVSRAEVYRRIAAGRIKIYDSYKEPGRPGVPRWRFDLDDLDGKGQQP